jgi:hypothetical protein
MLVPGSLYLVKNPFWSAQDNAEFKKNTVLVFIKKEVVRYKIIVVTFLVFGQVYSSAFNRQQLKNHFKKVDEAL